MIYYKITARDNPNHWAYHMFPDNIGTLIHWNIGSDRWGHDSSYSHQEFLKWLDNKRKDKYWTVKEVTRLEVLVVVGMPSVEDYIDKEEL